MNQEQDASQEQGRDYETTIDGLTQSSATKVIIEVTAGVLPGEPIPDKTKRWSLTSDGVANQDTYLKTVGHAHMYALMLQNPGEHNWVRTEWIYL